jgi:hypothetical protein
VRNRDEKPGDRTQGRTCLPNHLVRVHDAAKRSRQTRFTALLHHVDVEALERAFWRRRAPGVDGMTVETYEGRLADNLRELCDSVHSVRCEPLPVRRTYIPKADGRKRPLGILVPEDKIVQGAVAEVLSAIYEADLHQARIPRGKYVDNAYQRRFSTFYGRRRRNWALRVKRACASITRPHCQVGTSRAAEPTSSSPSSLFASAPRCN